MPRRLIFTVTTTLGYRVSLSRDRWREIIRYKHPAMAGNEQAVRACLAGPRIIRESVKDPEVHLYYAPLGQAYLCVVVAPQNKGDRFVVTVYFTKNIKKGKELWTK